MKEIGKIDIQGLDEIINGVNEKLGVQKAYMVLHSKIVLKLNELIEVVNSLTKDENKKESKPS